MCTSECTSLKLLEHSAITSWRSLDRTLVKLDSRTVQAQLVSTLVDEHLFPWCRTSGYGRQRVDSARDHLPKRHFHGDNAWHLVISSHNNGMNSGCHNERGMDVVFQSWNQTPVIAMELLQLERFHFTPVHRWYWACYVTMKVSSSPLRLKSHEGDWCTLERFHATKTSYHIAEKNSCKRPYPKFSITRMLKLVEGYFE